MLQWMQKGLQDWIRRQVEESESRERPKDEFILDEETYSVRERGKRFSIHYAQGGIIVEVERLDAPNSLHVVTEDQDLADCLAKILLLERITNK